MKQPNYQPRTCHRCSSHGCDRCNDIGYTVGPTHRPAEIAELDSPRLNYLGIQRRPNR